MRFLIQHQPLREYISGIRIEYREIQVILQGIRELCIIAITGFQVFLSTMLAIFVFVSKERIHHILCRTRNAAGYIHIQHIIFIRLIHQIESREQAGIVMLVRCLLGLGNACCPSVLQT